MRARQVRERALTFITAPNATLGRPGGAFLMVQSDESMTFACHRTCSLRFAL